MSLFGLLRVPKISHFSIKQEKPNKAVVKQEPLIANFKKEPNGRCDVNLSSLKVESVVTPIKQEIPPEPTRYIVKEEPVVMKIISPTLPTGCLLKRKRRKETPGSLRKREFRKAVHIHKILVAKDPESLSNRELDSLTWAEGVIVRDTFRRTKDAAAMADSNGVQLRDTMVNEERVEAVPERAISPKVRESQRTNALELKSDIITDTLQLAVVDFGRPGGRYSFEQGTLIENALGTSVANHVLKNLVMASPTYGKSSWHDGVIVLDCKDQLSYDFAKAAVSEMKLWRRSLLRAVPPQALPFMSKGRLFVPDLGIEADEVLDVLRSQNPLVNMSKWKVMEEEEDISKKDCKGYTLLMNEPPITLLENKRIRLFFGAGEVTLKLLECNWPE